MPARRLPSAAEALPACLRVTLPAEATEPRAFLPAGATIVLVAAALFLASLAVRALRDRLGRRAS